MKSASRMVIALCLAITLFVLLLVWAQSPASASEAGYPFCPTGFATLGSFVAAGTVTFDTDLLTFGGVPGGVEVDGVAVFAFHSVQVPLGTTVVGRGSRPLALLSKTTVRIDGTVIADGQSSINFSSGQFAGGPGGGSGAGGLNPGTGPGGGLPASAICCSGSGGAGFGGSGGAGGFALQGVGGPGGAGYGDLRLALQGGSGGAGGSTGTGGGGGGGGLFISSLGGLAVGSSGIISADGGDGAVSGFGASGGGSGGGVVLFALVVTNDGTVRADGGHGGKGGGFGAGGGGGGGRILVAGATSGTGPYSVVGGKTGLGGGPPQAPGSPGQDGAEGILDLDFDAFPPCNSNAAFLVSLSPVKVFAGLKNSDDTFTAFDVMVELHKDGDPVASGVTRCVRGLVRAPAKAREVSIAFDPFDAVPVSSGDAFVLTVLTRIGTNEDGTRCTGAGAGHTSALGLRLYYDSPSRKSRFDATITPNSAEDAFFHSDGSACPGGGGPSTGVTTRLLDDTAPVAEATKCQDSGSVNFAGGNPFRAIGTWSMTVP